MNLILQRPLLSYFLIIVQIFIRSIVGHQYNQHFCNVNYDTTPNPIFTSFCSPTTQTSQYIKSVDMYNGRTSVQHPQCLENMRAFSWSVWYKFQSQRTVAYTPVISRLAATSTQSQSFYEFQHLSITTQLGSIVLCYSYGFNVACSFSLSVVSPNTPYTIISLTPVYNSHQANSQNMAAGNWYHISVGVDYMLKDIALYVYDASSQTLTSNAVGPIGFDSNMEILSTYYLLFGLNAEGNGYTDSCGSYAEMGYVPQYLVNSEGAVMLRNLAYNTRKKQNSLLTNLASLSALYNFEYSAGGGIPDYSGQATKLTGSYLITPNSKTGASLSGGGTLTGSANYPTGSTYRLTVAVWINIASPTGGNQIFNIGPSNELVLYYTGLTWDVKASNQVCSFSVNGITAGQWNLIIIAADYSGYFGSSKIFISYQVGTNSPVTNLCSHSPIFNPNTSSITIGPFTGQIKYFAMIFGFDLQYDFYHICYDNCLVSIGQNCPGNKYCSNGFLFWQKGDNCENPNPLTNPGVLNCESTVLIPIQCECDPGYTFASNYFGCSICTDPHCTSCTAGPNICDACISPFRVYEGACQSECFSYCSSCTAPNDNSCTSCYNPYYLYYSSCSLTCPSGYYGSGTNCYPCASPCKTCTVTSGNCESCVTGTFLPFGATIGTCGSTCPPGYYGDTTTGRCIQCDPSCATCYGQGNQLCFACANGAFYLPNPATNISCYTTCPPGYYGNTLSYECIACNPVCATCTGGGQSQCVTCASSSQYEQGGVCYNCYPTCQTCNAAGQFSCTSCYSGATHTITGECLTLNCQNGYYPDPNTANCEQCPSPCLSCQSETYCTTCPTIYANLEGVCTPCSQARGFYMLNISYCKEICGDGRDFHQVQCDDGNLINGDGCNSQCEIEPGWACYGGTYDTPDHCHLLSDTVLVYVYGNTEGTPPTINVEYSGVTSLKAPANVVFKVVHTSDQVQFTDFSLLSYEGNTYSLDMSRYPYQTTIEYFNVTLASPYSIVDANGTVVAFWPYNVPVNYESIIAFLATFTDNPFVFLGIIFLVVRLAFFGPIFVNMAIGTRYMAWMTLDSVQTLASYEFLNTVYPTVVERVFSIPRMALLSFFPNLFSRVPFQLDFNHLPPPRFYDLGYYTLLFLSVGGAMTLAGTSMAFGFLMYSLNKNQPNNLIIEGIHEFFDFKQLRKFWFYLIPLFFLGSVIQLSYSTFTNAEQYAGGLFAAIMLLGVVVTMIVMGFYNPKAFVKSKKKETQRSRHQVKVYQEFKPYSFVRRFVALGILCRVVNMFILQQFYNNVPLQGALCIVTRIIPALICWIKKPFRLLSDNKLFCALEIVKIAIMLLLIFHSIEYNNGVGNNYFSYMAMVLIILYMIWIMSLNIYHIKYPMKYPDYIDQRLSVPTVKRNELESRRRRLNIVNHARDPFQNPTL